MRADRTPVSGLWPALRSGGRLFTLTCHWGERWRLILDFEPCTEKILKLYKNNSFPCLQRESIKILDPKSFHFSWLFGKNPLPTFAGHRAFPQATGHSSRGVFRDRRS